MDLPVWFDMQIMFEKLVHVIHFFRFNFDPSVQVPPKQYSSADVGGSDRYKFFKR